MEHRHITVDGCRLHLAESGRGEPVVLLHGFPECWYSWRRQLPALAAAGYRAIAPDLRGYNESDAPRGLSAYRASVLVHDIAGLIDQAADGAAHLVGHDWGGVLAWLVAARHPERVRKLTILNAPHPARYRQELQSSLEQWFRSWYALFFQLPGIPEELLSAGDFKIFRQAWQHEPVAKEAFTDDDIAFYVEALRRHGLTAPLNYYRAALRFPEDLEKGSLEVTAPTLLIWGERDPYLSVRLTEGLEPWTRSLHVERLADASHWVQNDAPETVNRLLLEFLCE